MNEIKWLLSTLTQQFTSRIEEGNALRASRSRNPERIGNTERTSEKQTCSKVYLLGVVDYQSQKSIGQPETSILHLQCSIYK